MVEGFFTDQITVKPFKMNFRRQRRWSLRRMEFLTREGPVSSSIDKLKLVRGILGSNSPMSIFVLFLSRLFCFENRGLIFVRTYEV